MWGLRVGASGMVFWRGRGGEGRSWVDWWEAARKSPERALPREDTRVGR